MIKRLDLLLFTRFMQYFFLLYCSFVLLYLVVDCCEKKIRVVSGFELYCIAHFKFLLLDRLSMALYATTLVWLRSLIVLGEWRQLLILHIPLYDRIRAFCAALFLIVVGDICVQHWIGEQWVRDRWHARQALIYKKKQVDIAWKRLSDGSYVRYMSDYWDRSLLPVCKKGNRIIIVESDKKSTIVGESITDIIVDSYGFFFDILHLFVQSVMTVLFFWVQIEFGFVLWQNAVVLYGIYYGGILFLRSSDVIVVKLWILAWVSFCVVLYMYMYKRERRLIL